MPVSEKDKFVIRHTFTDVMNMKFGDEYKGPKEYHFRFLWKLRIFRAREHFLVRALCWSTWEYATRGISINDLEMITKGKWYYAFAEGWVDPFPAKVKYCLIDGNLKIEVHVGIRKVYGLKEKYLRNFDKSMKSFSDVVLVVKNQKFYVLKKYLAAHSTYFKALFSENIDKSDHVEIKLYGIQPYDFQNFLEVLHGEPAVTDATIYGVLRLAEMFDSMTVCRKCKAHKSYKLDWEFKTKVDELEKKHQRPLRFLFGEKKWESFDKSMKNLWDIVLKVDGEKFYVSKKYLASHSSYFESLFFGDFDESGQSEITLKKIDPFDFQNFLEVLYGKPVINDSTVKGILKLADMYCSKTAIRRCEEFLSEKSKLFIDEKYQLAINYSMEKLKAELDVKKKAKENSNETTDGMCNLIVNYTKSCFEFPGFMLGICFRKLKYALRK